MGIFATGDQNAYQGSSTMQPGSQAWNEAKAREKSFSDQMAVAEKEKGNKTPDYDKSRADIMALYDARKRLGGPADVVAAKAGYTGPSSVGAGYQSSGASMLNQASQGKGPSVAGAVMGQGVDDALRGRMAAAAGRPMGSNAALANTQAGGVASQALQQAGAQSAMAKAGEVQQASGAYGALGTTMRGQDLATMQGANAVNFANAGFAQQAGLQNQQATMNWQAMSDAEKRALLGMGISLDQNEMTNRLNYYNFTHGISEREQAQSMRDSMRQGEQNAGLVRGLGQGAMYGAEWYGANYPSEGSGDLVGTLRKG